MEIIEVFFNKVSDFPGSVIIIFCILMAWVVVLALSSLSQVGNQIDEQNYRDEVQSGLKEQCENGTPYYIAVDIAKQVIDNQVKEQYLNKSEKLGNLLPPIGMLGTILGLGGLFIRKSGAVINTDFSGLAIALLTTLIGMSCFILVEYRLIKTQQGLTKEINKIMRDARTLWGKNP